MSDKKTSELDRLLDDTLDILITDISEYIERAVNGEYPILFVGKYKTKAFRRLKANLMLKSDFENQLLNLREEFEHTNQGKQ